MSAVLQEAAVCVCIGCGCTDEDACTDGHSTCCWLRLDRAAGVGVCSCCPEFLDHFDASKGTMRAPFMAGS